MLLKNVIAFYRNPVSYWEAGKGDTFFRKIRILKNSFLMCFGLSFLIFLFLIIPIDAVLKSEFQISFIEDFNQRRREFLASRSEMQALLRMCVLGPFIEECLFRLPLITRSLSLKVLLFVLLIEDLLPNQYQFSIPFVWYSILLLIIFGAVIMSNYRLKGQYSGIKTDGKYNYSCWFLTVIFGLVHIYNFAPLHLSFVYLYPIYVLPQFVYGVVFSYIAVRYNTMLLPFLLHVFINSTGTMYKMLTSFWHMLPCN